ncbi:hypothetical protein [Pseudomonas sp. R1-15]|uniref:hypothetical protein n=1 Tax=Pseudomonas sp. R1-15 TaxID=2817399 RepID=UPI003DA95547
MDASKILPWIAVLFGFSGWFKVFLDHLSNKPKITGEIINVVRGQADIGLGQMATFLTYPYLHNLRKNAMHILDYRLRVKVANKWVEVHRFYGIEFVPSMSFTSINGTVIQIPDFAKKLIYKKDEPVEQGVPLHGWLLFAGSLDLYESKISEYELICIDVNKKLHKIRSKPEGMNDLLLAQFAEIQVPKDMRPDVLHL